MSNDDYVVGRAYGEMAPNQSYIYEVLLKKAERERDEARALLERKWHEEDPPLIKMMRERDHYKQALEEISTTIQEYKDSIVQEPSEDFIWAIKAWADKKLKEI